MKNTIKVLGIIAIIAIIGFSMIACDNGNVIIADNDNDLTITLDANPPYGWQKTYCPVSLFSGEVISTEDVYTFTYSFRSNVSMDYLQIFLVDNCLVTGWSWNVISDYVLVEQNVIANTIYTGTVTITANGTATNTTPEANRLVFQAGSETASKPKLTFTELNIVKDTSGGTGIAPNTPTGVSATAQSSSSITISWDSVSGAIGYYIYRYSSSTGTYGYIGHSNSTSYTETGLAASTTYFYTVAAYNAYSDNGISPQSSSVSATTHSSGGGTSLPSAPTGVTATTISSSSISVSWNAVTGATSYKVYYKIYTSGSSTDTSGLTLFNSTSNTSITVTGLSPSTFYIFYVRATNSAGDSNYSMWDYAQTNSSGGGISIPSAPTGVTATRNPAGSTTVRVSWNSVSGATSYNIYYSTTGTGSGWLDGSSITTSFNSEGNDTTSTWYFRVTAVNSAGESSPSSWVSVSPVTGGGTPSAPIISNVDFTPSGNGLRITWSSVSNAVSYRIYISGSKYGSFILLNSTSSTTYDDTTPGLNNPGSGYYYQVTAVNANGESARSIARGITLPTRVPVCFYTRAYDQRSTNTIANVIWATRWYLTGYRVTIGSTEYLGNYSRGSSARTSADESIYPGTYNYQTRFRYDVVRVATNSSTPDDVISTNLLSSYVNRGNIELKLGYRYQINAETGEATRTKTLVMD